MKITIPSLLSVLFLLIMLPNQKGTAQSKTYRYGFQNPTLSFEKRVEDLLSRLTLSEKIGLMQNDAKSVPRLGIKPYNWWNECLHGVARDGIATVFPQAIALASTWNTPLMHQIAATISTEARAKHEQHVRDGQYGIYQGLSFWTPNINIFRDPRWGRGQETYGEDPFLTSKMGVAFVRGLQGDDPKYFKVIATAKHFAIHSGSEYNRHVFNAVVSKEDMFDTYLPAFESLVKDAKVYSIMGAYNSVDGVPACANNYLLDTILRQKWGFKGYVVSDCGAISDIYLGHKYAKTKEEASALGVKAGCDLSCGSEYASLDKSLKEGFILEKQIDISVSRLLMALFKLGIFDSSNLVAYQNITFSENNDPKHNALSKKAAEESMVLLQNKSKLLPLSKKLKSIAVVGPFANDDKVLLGNYNGEPSSPVNYLKGIRDKVGGEIDIITSDYIKKPTVDYTSEQNQRDSIALMVKSCSAADLVIFCGGISASVEGEESGIDKKGFFHGDRTTIGLPDVQQEALKALKASGKKVILVISSGSALAVNWADKHLDGIIEAWYPGQMGGAALADILFGDANPAGRLPVTFYASVDDLPAFEDYSMKGRTYRYFKGKPLYAFGYGLSYSHFDYQKASISSTSVDVSEKRDSIRLFVKIKNSSGIQGDEVIQVYGSAKNVPGFRALRTLIGFKRVSFKPGETKTVPISIAVNSLREYDTALNDYRVLPGVYSLGIGGSSEDLPLSCQLEIH